MTSVPTRVSATLSFRNIGAVYVWLVIVVLFSVWAPDTFPTAITVKQVLNGNAVAGLVALSVVPPLAARVFDLSVAYTMSLTSVLTAHFLVSTGLGPFTSIALAMTAALLVGVVNALVVVVLRVDSFIATLATGAPSTRTRPAARTPRWSSAPCASNCRPVRSPWTARSSSSPARSSTSSRCSPSGQESSSAASRSSARSGAPAGRGRAARWRCMWRPCARSCGCRR